nr:MAG: hypothetical protein [Chiromantes dehaani nimavirus]
MPRESGTRSPDTVSSLREGRYVVGKKGREPSPDYSRQQQQQHLRHPAAKFNMHVPLSPPSLPDSPPSYEEVQQQQQQQQQPSPLKALEAAQSSGGAGGNAMGGGLDPETAEIELGPDFIFFVAFTVGLLSGAMLLWGTGWLWLLRGYVDVIGTGTGSCGSSWSFAY